MKTIYKLFALIIFISQSVNAQALKFEVNQPKEDYIKGELIEIGIGIKNISNTTIKPDLFESVKVRMFNENGSEISYKGPTFDLFTPYAPELKKDEEVYRVVELNPAFGTRFALPFGHAFFNPGRYTVKIYFTLNNKIEDSTSLVFNVQEPQGDELIVYNGMVNTLGLIFTEKYTDERFSGELRALADSHPNSVYMPILLDILHTCYRILLPNAEKAKAVDNEIVEKCSRYGRSIMFIGSSLRETISKTEKVNRLKKLKEKARGSVMEKYFDVKIKQVD